jgi:hypothetical protein
VNYYLPYDDEFLSEVIVLCCDSLEYISFGFLLYHFRPRSEWPEFYGTGIENLNNIIGANHQRNDILMPIIEFNIKNENIFDCQSNPQNILQE